MIVLLQRGQGAASKGDGVMGRAPLPVLPWRHPSPTEKACRNQGTPGWAQTGLFTSRHSWPPELQGADPPDPSSLLFLVRHTRVTLCWQIP